MTSDDEYSITASMKVPCARSIYTEGNNSKAVLDNYLIGSLEDGLHTDNNFRPIFWTNAPNLLNQQLIRGAPQPLTVANLSSIVEHDSEVTARLWDTPCDSKYAASLIVLDELRRAFFVESFILSVIALWLYASGIIFVIANVILAI